MFWKKKVKKPSYEDLMAIVTKLETTRDIADFNKFFVMHLCFEFLGMSREEFDRLSQVAYEAAAKARIDQQKNIESVWN